MADTYLDGANNEVLVKKDINNIGKTKIIKKKNAKIKGN